VPAQSAAHSPGEEENQHKKPQNSDFRRPKAKNQPQILEMIHFQEKKGKKKTSKSNLHSLKLQEQSSNFSLQWNSSKNHQEDFSQEVRMCA